jgi:hypothetical protein
MRTKPVKSEWALVAVHWVDAFDGENGWTDLDKYEPKEATVVTVGWLIPDVLQGYITLVNSYFPDEVEDPKTVGMPIHIPLGMIIETKILEQPTVLIQNPEESQQELPSGQTLPSFLPGYPPSQGKSQNAASLLNRPHE